MSRGSEVSHATAQRRNVSEDDPKDRLRGVVAALREPLLLRDFARIAEAPDAVPRLRRFVLDLAVRGKLVEQDPNDEPASALLERIRSQKDRIGRERRANPELKAKLNDHDSETRLPDNWVSAQISEVFLSVADGDHQPPPKADNGIPFLVIGNVRNGSVNFTGCRHVPEAYYDALDPIRRPDSGALLYTLVGSYGIPVLVEGDRPFCVQRHIGILKPSSDVDVRFLRRAMESRLVFDQATACATGIAQKTVPLSGLRRIRIPLPPLAEQHRIVAKVDELMALCDRLEAAQAERERRRDRLAAASLHRLSNGADPTALRDHARFHLHHLSRLTTRLEHVHQLRQTIFNLAAKGKLVSQNASDEPATDLLQQMEREKERLTIDKGARLRRKVSEVPAEDEDDAELPSGWAWVRIGGLLFRDSQNGFSKRPDDSPTGIPILRISAGTARRDGIVAEEEHKRIGGVSRDLQEKFSLEPGDLLACRFNGNRSFVGRLSLYTGYLGIEMIYPDKLIRLRLVSSHVDPRLVRCFAESSLVREEIERYCATTVGNWGISASNLKKVRIPLPPLAEQRRIVAKVDELMALCDRLETQLAISETESRRLLEAVLHETIAAAGAAA